jgi:hypothetical protein
MRSRLRRRLSGAGTTDDAGTALVLALLIILLVGALLAVSLDLVNSGLSIQPNVVTARNESNYAQGAVDGAINNIRGSSTSGRTGSAFPCPTFFTPGTGASGATGNFKVTCEGKTAAGGSGFDEQPQWAIQTVDAAAGMGIHQDGNKVSTIDGGIFSAGDLTVAGAAGQARMDVFGSVYAKEQCHYLAEGDKPLLTSTDPILHCPYPTTGPLNVTPAWPAALTQAGLDSLLSSTTADPIPSCTGSGVITFTQGYYGMKPDDLVKKYKSTCSGVVMHFKPGNYYFDYPGTWDLSNASYNPPGGKIKVVGGEETNPTDLAGRKMGVACDEASAGVQFMFGGDSKINVDGTGAESASEGLELCGPLANAANTPQRISIYGVNAGPSTPTLGNGTLRASDPAGVVKTGTLTSVTGADNARSLADSGLSALMTFRDNDTATITLSGFSGPATVPAGSKITKITVRSVQRQVTSSEFAGVNGSASGAFTLMSGTTQIGATQSLGTAACSPCDRDLYTGAAGGPTWRDLSALSLAYTATGVNNKKSGMALDGLELIVEWTAPTLRPLPCTSPTCPAFLTTGTNPRVWIHGTVFAPTARIDIGVHNKGDTVFARGIVLRTLDFSMSASSKQTDAPFQLPNATATRRVLFKGYAPGDVLPRIRACVSFMDSAPPSGLALRDTAYPGWSLTIERWRVLRDPVDGDSCT